MLGNEYGSVSPRHYIRRCAITEWRRGRMQYSVVVLGATGNVGGRIVQLLIKNPLCKKLVVITRRKTDVFAARKVFNVVVNMDRIEEEVAPYAQGVHVALAAFGVGKSSPKMPEEDVRKIEIAYPAPVSRRTKPGSPPVPASTPPQRTYPTSRISYAHFSGCV